MPGRLISALAASLAIAALIAGTVTVALPVPEAAAAVTTTFSAVADSYVQADQPTRNFGTATTLKVDGSPVTISYLRFDVQGITGAPTKATLKVFLPVDTTTAINARSTDNTWTETGITFDNKPATGTTAIVPPKPWSANTTLSYDVTSLVTGPGLVSFALDTTSATSKSPPSREATTNQPQLVIETADGGTTTTPTTPPTTPPTTTTPPPGDSVTMAVGGDVACGVTEANYNGGAGTATACHMRQTANLVLGMAPQQAWALGDLQYNSGALSDFNASYGDTTDSWGQFKSITKPVVGNHEYGTSGAGGYFTYFGDAATPRQPGCRSNCDGYYSFDVTVGTATWHVAVINSECTRIGGGVGCAVASPQHDWLVADLGASSATCTAVLTHRPRWASNSFASPDIQPLVDVMMDASRGVDVDLLLTGHAHSYERFAPQNFAGQADPNGIREIVVGTGGRDSQGFGTIAANSVIHKNQIFGVMKLTLRPSGYDWAFVPDPATPFADSGSGSCT